MTTYHLVLHRGRKPVRLVLHGEKVVAWAEGYAAALGQEECMAVIDPTAAEETRRMQALQIGDTLGWWQYLYPEYDDDTEGTP